MLMEQSMLAIGNIMIVDGNPINLELLEDVLREQGMLSVSFH